MRKRHWIVGLVLMGLAVPASGDEVTEEELRKAHHNLQQALETIKEFHLAKNDYYDLEYATRLDLFVDARRVRMGVLVESTGGSKGGEAGAVILGVTPGGPADDAGLEVGDVVTRIDGVALGDGGGQPHEVLIRELHRHEDGDAVAVDFLRDGVEHSVTVALRGLSDDDVLIDRYAHSYPSGSEELRDLRRVPEVGWFFPYGWLDMELVSLSPELGEYFGVEVGVLVVRGPEADSLPLRGGDVIVAIGDRAVKDPTHAMRILRSYQPDEVMELEIIRHGRRESINASVPEHRVDLLEGWVEGGSWVEE